MQCGNGHVNGERNRSPRGGGAEAVFSQCSHPCATPPKRHSPTSSIYPTPFTFTSNRIQFSGSRVREGVLESDQIRPEIGNCNGIDWRDWRDNKKQKKAKKKSIDACVSFGDSFRRASPAQSPSFPQLLLRIQAGAPSSELGAQTQGCGGGHGGGGVSRLFENEASRPFLNFDKEGYDESLPFFFLSFFVKTIVPVVHTKS